MIVFNLFCLYVSIGGVAFLVSSISERRGRAVEYYQPANIIRTGTLPAADVAVLLGVRLVAWFAGREVVARRSICTT